MTPRQLKIAEGFGLPIDFATGTSAILATKGAGKSNAAVVMFEEMWDCGVPAIAIDPKGDWHGIRGAGDKHPGLPVVVFGGRHGDIPLEATAGALVADLILTNRLTCVLDVSQFTKAETIRFLLAFGRHLFQHADDEGAQPLHLFLEEAHEYLPQQVKGDQAELVNVWQRIVKQGRFKGLGVTLISQRSSVLNKDVLELVDTLIVLRTIGPRSRQSIAEWVKDQDVDPALMASLPSLKDGDAWLWSPGALGLLERIQFRKRRTFDSGATPKVGEIRQPPASIADVDLAAIKEAMSDTIEKAKAEDPRELRRQIAEFKKVLTQRERELADALDAKSTEVVHEVEVSVPVVTPETAATLREFATQLEAVADTLGGTLETLVNVAEAVVVAVGEARIADSGTRLSRARAAGDGARAVEASRAAQRPDPPARREPRRETVPRPQSAEGLTLGKAERSILTALVQKPDADSEQLAILADYHQRSKGYTNALGALRSAGLLEGIRLTDNGRAVVDELGIEPINDLWGHWYNHPKVDGAGRKILDALVAAWPEGLDRVALADAVGYHERSKGFTNAIGRLRTLQLVTRGADIRLSDDLGEALR